MKINQASTASNHFHSDGFHARIVSPQQALILEHMRVGKDYTIGELAWLTKIDKSAVSGRRNAMLKAGILERGLARKCVFSEVHCETVKLAEVL